jgi:hypothetical protein
MLRFFLTLTVLVATLGGAVVAVEAQPATPEPMNSSATETPTGETSTIQLSETMQIDEWRYENATFYVTISSEAYTALTITDAGKLSQALSEGEGSASTSIRQRTTRLDPDSTTTVVFRATEVDGAAAVTLTAANSDQLVLLRSDNMGGDRRPVEWQTTAGLVLLAAAGAAYWTYREAKKRWEDEKKEVSRIA